MWNAAANLILKFRILLLFFIAILTATMIYYGRKAELLQEFFKIIPQDDVDYQQYEAFKKMFGEDATALIIGLESSNLFDYKTINGVQSVTNQLLKTKGIEQILNYTQLSILIKNDSTEKFELQPLLKKPLINQSEADSFQKQLKNLPFYQDLVLNKTYTVSLCAITFEKTALNSIRKQTLIPLIKHLFDSLATEHHFITHYGGIPYFRFYIQSQLPKELRLFIVMALILTALALYLFYRSFYAVVFPLMLLGICAICTYGIIGILGYKISLISALLPAIIVILGVPPCIYILSDYHEEYKKTQDKMEALKLVIKKLGLVTFMINANTAFGFLTLYFTDIIILKEFGLVAFYGTILAYFITLILIPGLFSLLPPPTEKRLKHLDAPYVTRFINWLDNLVVTQKTAIYSLSILLTILSIWGLTKLKANAYMVDDLPTDDAIVTDLRFLEAHFKGVMPFEIMIDFGKNNTLRKTSNLKKIDSLQHKLHLYPEISKTISIVDAMKWARQALYSGDSSDFQLPNKEELPFLAAYSKFNSKSNQEKPLLTTLVDSAYQKARITGYVKDIGSLKMPALIAQLQQDIDSLFVNEKPKPTSLLTGTTRIFMKANEILIENLLWSLLAIFILIGLQMFGLFLSWRIMIISLIVNFLSLLVTAGIMGFFNLPLKPSTALIYGMAFGIAVDNSIHYLSLYHWKRKQGLAIPDAVSQTTRSTGMSIVYTSVVLFVGFMIFIPSSFGSTRALGILTSITLFIALFSNLLLLPTMLIHFDKEKTT